MVHGYHVIMGMYGFWLPNDPRGSWSDFVGAWELLKFGETTRTLERTAEISLQERQLRAEAKRNLKYPPVQLTGRQALSIGKGFASFCRKNRLAIWACSILPEHVHLVVARHRYDVEQIANLLKGAATRELRRDGIDPMAAHTTSRSSQHSPWAHGEWKVFLDSEEAIRNAIRYVEENPIKEGKPRQHWSFVTPFSGIDEDGNVVYL